MSCSEVHFIIFRNFIALMNFLDFTVYADVLIYSKQKIPVLKYESEHLNKNLKVNIK